MGKSCPSSGASIRNQDGAGAWHQDGVALGASVDTSTGWHWTPQWSDTSLAAQYRLALSTVGWHWAPVWIGISLHCRNGTGHQYSLALGSAVGSYRAPVWARTGHWLVLGASKDRSIAQLPRGCYRGLGPAQGDIPGGETGYGDTPGSAAPQPRKGRRVQLIRG